MRKSGTVALIIIFISCSTAREDVVFEAFTKPPADGYSLKLYSNGRFDLQIPATDYSGTYTHSGDTVFLKSIEIETKPRTVGPNIKGIVTEQHWIFLIDAETRKIRTLGNTDSISMDIVGNGL